MKRGYLLLGLVVFIAACTTETAPGNDTPFIGGTNGLIIEFLENAPPKEVADNGQFPFDIIVKLTNEGEHKVLRSQAHVTISGLFPADFDKGLGELQRQPPVDDLEPVRKDPEGNEIPGTQTQVHIDGLNYKGNLDGNVKFPVRAEVCYQYQTIANGQYCMRENLLDTDEGVCEVSGTKTIHNSGAPVQITSFKQSVAGTDTILLTFTVSQRGNGNIFKSDTSTSGVSCDSSSFVDENKVFVSVQTGLGSNPIKCLGLFDRDGLDDHEGYVLLTNGDATFTCTQEVEDVDAEKTVRVIMDYEYEEIKSTELIVKHLSQ